MNNVEHTRIVKPNLTVAKNIAIILVILATLSYGRFITTLFPYPIMYAITNWLYIPIDILSIILFLMFGQYLDNFKLKNTKIWVYLIAATIFSGMVIFTIDKILMSLAETQQGEGLLGLLFQFDHPYKVLIYSSLSVFEVLETLFVCILGVKLLSLKKQDYIGGLSIVGAFFILSACLFLITYGVQCLVVLFRDFPVRGTLEVVYSCSNIVNILMFISIGYVFHKADSYNKKID